MGALFHSLAWAGLRLRGKNMDFDCHVIVLREANGNKERVVISTVQELLGHSDVSTTITYTNVLKVAVGSTASPLDALALERCVTAAWNVRSRLHRIGTCS